MSATIIKSAIARAIVKEQYKEFLELDLVDDKTNWLDSIESPPVIFASCVLLGCVLGFLNYLRNERRHRNRLAGQNQVNNV